MRLTPKHSYNYKIRYHRLNGNCKIYFFYSFIRTYYVMVSKYTWFYMLFCIFPHSCFFFRNGLNFCFKCARCTRGRRRSVYRYMFRTRPDPLLEAFDCPDASQPTPARSTYAMRASCCFGRNLFNTFTTSTIYCTAIALPIAHPG